MIISTDRCQFMSTEKNGYFHDRQIHEYFRSSQSLSIDNGRSSWNESHRPRRNRRCSSDLYFQRWSRWDLCKQPVDVPFLYLMKVGKGQRVKWRKTHSPVSVTINSTRTDVDFDRKVAPHELFEQTTSRSLLDVFDLHRGHVICRSTEIESSWHRSEIRLLLHRSPLLFHANLSKQDWQDEQNEISPEECPSLPRYLLLISLRNVVVK